LLVRIDGVGCTHELVEWLTQRRLSYSIGFTRPANFEQILNGQDRLRLCFLPDEPSSRPGGPLSTAKPGVH
jgi:hypothetical protein